MDPLLDEKIILTTSASLMEIAGEELNIDILREAYGFTANEGLCYEFCARINFTGKQKGKIFFGMDGYSKILLLPYTSKKYEQEHSHNEMADGSLLAFVNHIIKMITFDMQDFISNLKIDDAQLVSHQLISLSKEKYRKYSSIFFLKDEKRNKYLGRIYLFFAFEKQ